MATFSIMFPINLLIFLMKTGFSF